MYFGNFEPEEPEVDYYCDYCNDEMTGERKVYYIEDKMSFVCAECYLYHYLDRKYMEDYWSNADMGDMEDLADELCRIFGDAVYTAEELREDMRVDAMEERG